jgi:hypothetical protein
MQGTATGCLSHRIRDDGHVALVDGDAALASPLSAQHLPVGVMIRVQLYLPNTQVSLIRHLPFTDVGQVSSNVRKP